MPTEVMDIIDSLFYVSPVVVLSMLFLSRVLRMCKWHKTACIVPLIPQAATFVDYYIISFAEEITYAFPIIVATMVVLLLIAAYKVFFK